MHPPAPVPAHLPSSLPCLYSPLLTMMLSQSLKRSRESAFDSELFTQDHSKKLCPSWHSLPDATPESASDLDQTLRFRASGLTPVDSSDDEDNSKHGGNLGTSMSPCKSVHGHRPPALQLSPSSAAAQLSVLAGGDNLSPWLLSAHSRNSANPSPIPHHLVNRSLSLNGAQSTVSTPGYFPTSDPAVNQPQQDHNMMEDVSFHSEPKNHHSQARLPSPVSDEDAIMANSDKTEDTEMDYFQTSLAHGVKPTPSQPTSTAGQYSQQTHEDLMKQAAVSASTHRKRPALVMGFRADCEKCRCRVPGHYSHILRN